MNQSFWLAFAAYLLPTFPLGYFWHLTTFREQYERLDIYREHVIIPFGPASMVLQALVFAWLYPRLFMSGCRVLAISPSYLVRWRGPSQPCPSQPSTAWRQWVPFWRSRLPSRCCNSLSSRL